MCRRLRAGADVTGAIQSRPSVPARGRSAPDVTASREIPPRRANPAAPLALAAAHADVAQPARRQRGLMHEFTSARSTRCAGRGARDRAARTPM